MNDIFETDYQKSRWKIDQERGERRDRRIILGVIVLFILYSIVITN